MDAIECIATRRSIRQFLSIPVDQETMLTVIEAGSNAPSSGNLQDWKFILVDDKQLTKKISEFCLNQDCVHNAGFLVVVCSDYEQTERHYGLRGERLYTVQNCAAASQNMLLAAHALGLGGNWVGAFDENKLRSILGIPGNVRPQAVLTFGYPAEVPSMKRIKSLDTVTFFNGYGATIRNVHRFFKDYHVDWEARISGAKTSMQRLSEKASGNVRHAAEKTKTEGKGVWEKIKVSEFLKAHAPKRKK